jgi:hypothetical protein
MLPSAIGFIAIGAIFPNGIAIGGAFLAQAIVLFVAAYGLLKGFGWAWTVTVILSIISIAVNAIIIALGGTSPIINIIISGIILYYLYIPYVKDYYRKK